MNDSAETIIRKADGHRVLAAWCGVAVHTVYRWTYPRSRGGTDGVIPQRYHQRILQRAEVGDVEVTAADLVGRWSSTSP